MVSCKNAVRRLRGTTLGLWLVLILALAPACRPGCARDDAAPRPSPTALLDTVEASTVGTRLIVTAGVAEVLTPQSFVVEDADLPDQGLLVLSDARTDLHRHDLVTVYGAIDRFDYPRFASRLQLNGPGSYRPFEGRKILVAADVSSRG